MCGTCGCSDGDSVTMTDPATGAETILREARARSDHNHGHVHTHADGTTHAHDHNDDHAHAHGHSRDHGHDHGHGHDHSHHDHGDHHSHSPTQAHGADGGLVALQTAVLAKNDAVAAQNRGWFRGRGVLALNLVSSPGAGKTSLLERTIRDFGGEIDIAVIEGDQMTTNDADRIRTAGARAIQINTGSGCHLEADMVASALDALALRAGSLLLIENVGNLVCPAMFDLGERMKVAVISVTEGEDKPLKYPHMFRAASVVVVNKIDLAPHVDFDQAAFLANIKAVNPSAQIIMTSARTGEGMENWRAFLKQEMVKQAQT